MENLGELSKKLKAQNALMLSQFDSELEELKSNLHISLRSALNTIKKDIQAQVAEQTERYKTYLFTLATTLFIPALLSAFLICLTAVAFGTAAHFTAKAVSAQEQLHLLRSEIQVLQAQRQQYAAPPATPKNPVRR